MEPKTPVYEVLGREIERLRALDYQDDGGATLNCDGSHFEGEGVAIGLNSLNLNLTASCNAPAMEFLQGYRYAMDEFDVKLGLFKFPQSFAFSVDLSVVLPVGQLDLAIKTARLLRQHSVWQFGTPGVDHETGFSGDEPMNLGLTDMLVVIRMLKRGILPSNLLATVEAEQTEFLALV